MKKNAMALLLIIAMVFCAVVLPKATKNFSAKAQSTGDNSVALGGAFTDNSLASCALTV